MIIELGDNGLRSRYWCQAYDIPGVDDPILAAYQAIRQRCLFLTDDNHTWEAKDYGECLPEHRKLKEYTQSSRYSIVINHIEEQGPYMVKYWFHFGYRIPGHAN